MLEEFFAPFRENIVGVKHSLLGPYGSGPCSTRTGRRAVASTAHEERLPEEFGPLVGNTHSESSATGMAMTRAYQRAQALLKAHVDAAPDDVIITQGSGMTAVVNKLQRMLGLRLPEQLAPFCQLPAELVRWSRHAHGAPLQPDLVAGDGGDVEVIPPDERGLGGSRCPRGAAGAIPGASAQDRRLHCLLERHRGADAVHADAR